MKKKHNIKNIFKQNEKHRVGKGIIAVLALMILLIAAFVTVLYVNNFTLELALSGDAETVIEYGDAYTEQGAEAIFYGKLFIREPIPLEVEVTGEVDTARLGSYTLTYKASYLLDYFFGSKKYIGTVTRTVTVTDSVSPEIELTYIEGAYTLPGHPYEEEGYGALDNYDGDITANVSVVEEDGRVYYSVKDSSGNEVTAVREIFYDDPIPPELKLLGDGDIIIAEGGSFKEPGYAASDNIDGDLTSAVTVSGTVDTTKAGNYTLTYTVTDAYRNTVTLSRPVTVKPRVEVPEGTEPYGEPVNPNGKVIYLTFDDGPGKHTERLLDVLDKYGIKATFFVVNTGYLDILPRMVESGHTVAMHTETHVYEEVYSSEEAYFNDLSAIQSRIEEKTGISPMMLRFPGGGSNMISKFTPGLMTRLTAKVKELGYRYFDWNVDSCDAGGTKTTEGVYNNVVSYVPNHQYSVVLQHDIYGYSVDAVEKIITWGLENGYTFKALTENSPVCEHKVNN